MTGVVLLDALYGEMDRSASWIINNRSAFFISAYTHYTKRRDDELARILRDKGIPVTRELNGPLRPGRVAFLATGEGIGIATMSHWPGLTPGKGRAAQDCEALKSTRSHRG